MAIKFIAYIVLLINMGLAVNADAQQLIIVPTLDLVIANSCVYTQGDYNQGKILSKVNQCIDAIILFLVNGSLGRIVSALSNTVAVIMMLSVIFLGIKTGLHKYYKGHFGGAMFARWALRYTFVGGFAFSLTLQSYLPGLMNASSNLAGVILQAMDPRFSGADIFAYFDQIIRTIIGYATIPPGEVGGAPDRTAIYFTIGIIIVGLFFTGPLGVMVGTAVIGILISVLVTFASAIFMFLIIKVVMVLLVAISPIMIPLYLFKYTRVFFDRWLSIFISYTLQPMMVMAFLGLMVPVFDSLVADYNQFYQDVRNRINNPQVANRIDLFQNVMSQQDKRLTGSGSGLVVGARGSHLMFQYDRTSGTTRVNTSNPLVAGVTGMDVSVPYLHLEWDEAKRLLFLLIVTLITFSAMVGFMKELPKFINNFIGDKTIGNVVESGTKIITDMGENVKGMVGGR